MADAKVGLVLALDGEKEFSAALQSATESVRLARASLKQVEEQYKGNANSLQALIDKDKALRDIENALKNQRSAADAGLTKSNENLHKIATALEDYRQKIDGAKASLSTLTAGTDAYKKQEKALEDLESAYARERAEQQREIQSYTRYQTAITKANTALTKVGKEIEDNNQYMDEARNSADGCATSIDSMGKKVKTAGDAMQEAGSDAESFGKILEDKLWKQFTKEKLVELAISAVKRLGRAMADAAKETMKVGMGFEQQMSKVAAISGATGREFDQLRDKAKDLGQNTVYSATEAGEAMQQMALAGWTTNDIMSGIDGVLALAASSEMDLGQAAEYVTDNLNAFGKSAEYSGRLSDIMATAMANSSMTTEELGEAYGKVAASAGAYGFKIEDVTAVLMNMANSGKKSGEAGTALNTIMVRLATNTKDCADALEEAVGHDVVYDAAGNMRSLSDILTDLGGVWDTLTVKEKNALAAQLAGTKQSNALNTIMAGMSDTAEKAGKSFGDYLDMLEKCNGAAKDMSDTMLNNLTGDVTLFNDALSGLAIELYDNYLSGPARSIVQTLTTGINGITDAIKPQRSELESFISEISASNDEVQRTLSNAQGILDNAAADTATLEAYKDILLELNSQESLTEFQKYQVANAVSALSGSIPELGDAFDEATGKISLTNDELERLFGNAERSVMQQALLDAQAESMKAYADAQINKAKADSAAQKALEEYNEASNFTVSAEETALGVMTDSEKAWNAKAITLSEAKIAQEEADKAVEEAAEQIRIENEALAGLKEEYGLADDSTSDFTAGQEQAAETAVEVSEEIRTAYEDMQSAVSKAIEGSVSMFEKFSGGSEIGLQEVKENLQSQIDGITAWKENMETIGAQAGEGISQEFYDYLVSMGPEAANLVAQLADSITNETDDFKEISDKWTEAMSLGDNTDAIVEATQAGKDYASALAEGLAGSASEVESAVQTMTEGISSEIEKAAEESGQSAEQITEEVAGAIEDGTGEVESAAEAVAEAVYDGMSSNTDSFSDVGVQMMRGVASGIQAGGSDAVAAAVDVATKALAAAKQVLGIRSPSRKFRDEVGKQMVAGMAFGIKDNTSLASKQAANMSMKVFNAASSWLNSYKKAHSASIADEAYYWSEVIKHVKKGTKAYSSAISNMMSASLKESGMNNSEVSTAAKKIANNFNVSWMKETGSGKNKKKVKKDAEDYYSDVYSAASKYAKNMQTLYDWSDEAELAYWTKVQAKLKKGTQAWYDAQAQIKSAQKNVAKSAEDARKEAEEAEKAAADAAKALLTATAQNQSTILDYWKTYNRVSKKAEMEYWAQARMQFAEGTDERIAADKKFFDARQSFYNDLKKLDDDYASDYQDILDDLKDKVDDLTQTYTDSVKESKNAILSSVSLFDEFDVDGFDADTLLRNLETQVEGLALWEQKLEELKQKGISTDLYDYLVEQGPDAAANIYSIASMTDEQLKRYQELFSQRDALAQSQAVKNNESLLKDTNDAIAEARRDADTALSDLNKTYRDNLSELTEGVSASLMGMLSQAGSIGEEAVATLFAAFSDDGTAAYSVSSTTDRISDELSMLIPQAQTIGEQALQGILDAFGNSALINNAAQDSVDSIVRAFQMAADIHSPSRLFRGEIGYNITAGVAEGITDGTEEAILSAQNVVADTLSAAQEELMDQERGLQDAVAGISTGGISMLNGLTKQYNPQTVVNVDNSGVVSILAQMISTMQDTVEAIGRMSIVLDSGDTVGALSDKMDVALAENSIRRKRGRRR